jgi:hypothetical protein
MPNKRAPLVFSSFLFVMPVSCRAHRPVVDLQPNASKKSSLTDTAANATLKITALSLPPQAFSFDRLEVTLQDPTMGNRMQTIDSYTINTAIPIKSHRNYNLTVRAYSADDLLYSSEYCGSKKSFRSQLGLTLLTVSLCETLDDDDDDEPATPTN